MIVLQKNKYQLAPSSRRTGDDRGGSNRESVGVTQPDPFAPPQQKI